MMGFETITLVPIDLNLVEPSLLTRGERAWLNALSRTGARHDFTAGG